jgi:hypothetical protein
MIHMSAQRLLWRSSPVEIVPSKRAVPSLTDWGWVDKGGEWRSLRKVTGWDNP